jgi:hypothetical protein
MAQLTLTADILAASLEGFEAQKNRLDAQIAELKQMLNGNATQRVASNGDLKPKRTVSAAARRKMARAQRLRWKKVKQAATPKAMSAKPKRKRSAASRKRMAVAQRKRWAAMKAASVPHAAVAKKPSVRKSGLKNVAAVSAKRPRVAGRKGAAKKKVIGASR